MVGEEKNKNGNRKHRQRSAERQSLSNKPTDKSEATIRRITGINNNKSINENLTSTIENMQSRIENLRSDNEIQKIKI